MVRPLSMLPRVAAVIVLLTSAVPPVAAVELESAEVAALNQEVLLGSGRERQEALAALAARGKADIAATLILAMRYKVEGFSETVEAFHKLTGSKADNWFDAMLWQEAHPEVVPHPSYREAKLALFERIDPQFLRFLGEERGLQENLRIRLEEITWGGVRVDGIPSLDNPTLIAASEANYLLDDDLVFGVTINGDSRAYPLRIMGWHEMFNDVIGGVSVALAYCTLCGSGILYETAVSPYKQPFVFGSSGFLYRSNKLMFDRQTDSLWNQFTGKPVSGPLVDSGIELKIRPVTITSWRKWRERQPATKVLTLGTGYARDYGSGVVYRDYFASRDLMFPTQVDSAKGLQAKDYVFGMRSFAAAKAWPLKTFAKIPLLNDSLGSQALVLLGDPETRTVRAYARGNGRFAATDDPTVLLGPGGLWQVEDEGLRGPKGETLARLPGHIAYWFAWDGYLGQKSELYQAAVAE